jgi:16S rRNA (uracil1498-N3)-methyltransferase
MHRFFLTDQDQISNSSITINTPELLHQLLNVLRVKVNKEIILINQQDLSDIQVKITSISKKQIQTQIISKSKPKNEPKTKLHIFFPILKKADKLELILQKGTEIGISEFTPLITQRTEKPILPKLERLQKIIKEASEQCGRTSIPTLNNPIKFTDCLNLKGNCLIANPLAPKSINEVNIPKNINLFIGPEGGFTPEEISIATSNNFQDIRLGQLILRAETACIVASSKILL